MFGLAATTPYDLKFRLLDVPVRVHPFFWLVMAVISGQENQLKEVLLFVACAFLSVLVHEFGHGLMARALGYRAQEIVLYAMGGYCVCQGERQKPWHRVAVLLAGPGAGFLLLGAVLALAGWTYGITPAEDLAILARMVGLGEPVAAPGLFRMGGTTFLVFQFLVGINLLWGIFNLLPIWPLDGGQLCEVFLGMYNRHQATRWAHIVSIVAAACLAAVFLRKEQMAMGIWFAYFGFINYQALQALHQSAAYGAYDDDADWWKR